MYLPRSGQLDKPELSSNSYISNTSHLLFKNAGCQEEQRHNISDPTIPRCSYSRFFYEGKLSLVKSPALEECDLVEYVLSSSSQSSSGTSEPFEESGSGAEAVATLGIASLQVKEEKEDEGVHEVISPDGNPNVRNQITSTFPRLNMSPPNCVEMSQLESNIEGDRSQGSPTPDTVSDNGEEWSSSCYTPDSSSEKWGSGSNLEIPSSGVSALTLVGQALAQDAMSAATFLDSRLDAKFTSLAGYEGSSSNTNSNTTSTSNSANSSKRNSSSSSHGRKRSREEEGDPAGGDGGPPERSRLDPRGPQDHGGSLKLACPFYKHNPEKYNVYDHKFCVTTACDEIARVKQHLARYHMQPPFCFRCKQVFRTQDALRSHLAVPDERFLENCMLREGPDPDGVTPEMEKKLSGRWSSSMGSLEVRWTKIYYILFPGDQPPSPYFETIPATPFGESSTTQGFRKPSPSKLQHAIVGRIMSLPEQNKSALIRIVEEEYRNPANQAISKHAPISAVPREDILKSQAMPSETQHQASWEALEEGRLAISKGKDHQIYTSISQLSGFSSAAKTIPTKTHLLLHQSSLFQTTVLRVAIVLAHADAHLGNILLQ